MYDIETKYTAALLAHQAQQRQNKKALLQDAHKYASQNTESHLPSVQLLNSKTLYSPNPNRVYFKLNSKVYSILLDQLGGEIEKTMGCDCFAVSDADSIETCLNHIVAYYSLLTDYIYQHTGVTIHDPYRHETGIEIPQEETVFFQDDANLGEYDYE